MVDTKLREMMDRYLYSQTSDNSVSLKIITEFLDKLYSIKGDSVDVVKNVIDTSIDFMESNHYIVDVMGEEDFQKLVDYCVDHFDSLFKEYTGIIKCDFDDDDTVEDKVIMMACDIIEDFIYGFFYRVFGVNYDRFSGIFAEEIYHIMVNLYEYDGDFYVFKDRNIKDHKTDDRYVLIQNVFSKELMISRSDRFANEFSACADTNEFEKLFEL